MRNNAPQRIPKKRAEPPKFCIEPGIYRRAGDFIASPFRYPGGKFYALKYILPFLNAVPHDEFREPFVGGGNIFFAKSKSHHNWLNDSEPNLMDTYRAIADKILRKKLISKLSKEVANRERHAEIKIMKTRSLFDIAFKTYYLNRTSYSGIINKPAWGYQDGKSSPPRNWGKFVENAGEKLTKVELTTEDFEAVIKTKATCKSVLMYLDPPYYHADQKRAYINSFSLKDHLRLAKLLKNTDFLFCLSYDDCEEIRALYKWAEINEFSWLYNTANKVGNPRKLGKELIITNYKIQVPSQGKFFC